MRYKIVTPGGTWFTDHIREANPDYLEELASLDRFWLIKASEHQNGKVLNTIMINPSFVVAVVDLSEEPSAV